MSDSEALELALALHATPQRAGQLRARALPTEGVTRLLRLALAQHDALADATRETDLPAELLVDAARFFVEQQMLLEDCENDPWRVLGLPPGASEHNLREHHRLLVRLVHPDRSSEWPAAFADRVNKAWRRLRRPEGRINAEIPTASLPVGDGIEVAPYRPNFAAPSLGLLPTAAPRLRYLPLLLIGGIVVTATALLWLDGWVTANYGGDFALAGHDSEPAGAAGRVDRDADLLGRQGFRIEPLSAAAPVAPLAAQESARREPDIGLALGLGAFFSYMGSTWDAHQRMRANQTEPAAVVQARPASEAVQAQGDSRAAARPPVPDNSAQAAIARPRATVDVAAVSSLRVQRRPAALPLAVARLPAALQAQQVAAPESADNDVSRAPAESLHVLADQADLQVRQLLQRFGSRYREGDLLGLLELFALNANAEEGGVPSLAAEYSQVFGATRSRAIRFDGVHWVQDRGRIRGGARVEIETRVPGRGQRNSNARIEFEVVLDGQQARIMRWVSSAASGGA